MRPSRSCAFFNVRIRADATRRGEPLDQLQRVPQLLHRDAHLVQPIRQVEARRVLDGSARGAARGVPRARGPWRDALPDRADALAFSPLRAAARARFRTFSRSKSSMRSANFRVADAGVLRQSTRGAAGRPARGTSPPFSSSSRMSSATSSSRTGPSACVSRRTERVELLGLGARCDERKRRAQPARGHARLVQRRHVARLRGGQRAAERGDTLADEVFGGRSAHNSGVLPLSL